MIEKQLDLDVIKARLAAATPAPWWVDESRRGVEAQAYGYPIEIVARTGRADAVLIAHAPGDIAALVAEIERLREGEDGYRQGHSDGCEDERAAVVAWLREAAYTTLHDARAWDVAEAIERGEHRREEER
jgi:hypothetical protein